MKLSKRDLQLHLLKQSINYLAPRLLGSLEVREPRTVQGQIIVRAWGRLEKAIALEAQLGLREDANFANFARAGKRALLFLTETDNYYARWMGLLLQELAREVNGFRARFSYEEALKAGGRPVPLKREVFEAHREELCDLALSGYLTRLEDLSPPERDALRGGWYFLKFSERGSP